MTGYTRQFWVSLAVALVLWLSSSAFAQQEEIGPLNLSGNLGFGYSSLSAPGISNSSPIMTGDADLLGYWKDPRILVYDFSPFLSEGNSVTSASDLVNRGSGFTASSTFMGGSPFPVTITYSRLWQDFPGFTTTGNPLSGAATSFASSDLGLDWGVYWGKLPPITFHYGTGSNDTELPSALGGRSDVHTNIFTVGSHDAFAGWNLDGGYSRSNLNATRIDLTTPGQLLPEDSHSEDLHGSAQRKLPLQSQLTFLGGQRQWDDNTADIESNSSYDYVRALATSQPLSRLNLNFNAGYTTNETAAAIQQLLGQGSPVPTSTFLSQSLLSGRTVDYGGGGQFTLPRGFSIGGDVSAGTFTNSLTGNEGLFSWDASLNYIHTMGPTGALTASYTYQDAQTDGASGTTHTLRAGFSKMVQHNVQLGGTVHYDQSVFTNVVPLSPGTESTAHGYGLRFNGGTPLRGSWKLAGDFEYDNHITTFPLNVTVNTKAFGVRAESNSLQLALRRSYHSGLALQVGNSLIFVPNPENALQSPLASILSQNSNVQTTFIGTFRPGRKRLSVTGTYNRFGYDNKGLHITDATLIDAAVSYRLRRLTLQTGYLYSNSQVFTIGTPAFHRREIYFEVLRHFRLF
jgi:hypothetical protein